MRRFRNHKKRLRGRPTGDDTKTVLALIEGSKEPISTKSLLMALEEATSPDKVEQATWDNRCTAVRRMLRVKEQQGEIQCLGVSVDGSYLWVHKKVPVMQCAAFVANEFLKRRQADACLDPEEFEQWAGGAQEPAGEF